MQKFCLALLFLIASKSLALDNEVVQKDFALHARSIVQDLCSTQWASAWSDQMWAGVRHSFTADDFMTLPPELKGLLQSDGYELGLNDCFGSDREAKNRFTIALLVASSSARFLGLYGPYWGANSMVRGMITAPQWLPVTRWAMTRPQIALSVAQNLKHAGTPLMVVAYAVTLTSLSLSAASMICEHFKSCAQWLRRQQLPSRDDLQKSLNEQHATRNNIALSIAVQKLEEDKRALLLLPASSEFDWLRHELKNKITQRTQNIHQMCQHLGLPSPI